ncbi:protein inturned-like isoform X3 [Porites lutea]|uniref:protein inturned-like isoform X3 n=1 Tax=Porites lutea TaxID=51062 RepID=UPI003CC6DCFA
MFVGQYYNHYPRYEDESSEEECEHCSRQDLYFREPVYEEPPWADHIKEKGDVFYIEPFKEPSPNDVLDSMEQLNISDNGFEDAREKGKLRGLNSVKKIFPGLKRDKADDKSNNEKNLKHSSSYGVVEGINSLNRLTGRFFMKEVQLIVTPRKAHSGSKNDLETLLGIIPGRDKAGKLSQTDSYSGSRLYIKGFVPDGPALRSGDLRIGDVLLSLNKLDLNSSNVHTILAAIMGPMEITLKIQRLVQPKISSPVIHHQTPPKNDSHLIKLISGEAPAPSKPDLKSITHVALYLTITSSEEDNEPDQVDVHCCLSELEAADYGEFADDYFQIRRLYTILGSSIFYKGYLVANHLPREDLEDVVLYCKYHCLLAMSAEQRVGQLVIWREVFPTRRSSKSRREEDKEYREPSARYFLLIVGMKHWLMCVLLEAGGISKRAEGHPPPNTYYVDQVKNTLHQIESMDIPSVCEASLRSPRNPPLASADALLISPPTTILQKSSSSFGGSDTPTSQKKHGSLDNLRLQDEVDSNDSGSIPSVIRRTGSDSSGSLGSFGAKGKLRSLRSQFSLNSAGTFRKSLPENMPDLSQVVTGKLTGGIDNTLFHYVSWDSFHGIVVCPNDGDAPTTGGLVHAEVVNTFQKTCLSMRRLFSPYYKQRLKQKNPNARFTCTGVEGAVEHGVMFHRIPDNASEQKKSPSIFKYWVIGRLLPGDHPHELYVCHHQSVPQSVVELAFKLGFGV